MSYQTQDHLEISGGRKETVNKSNICDSSTTKLSYSIETEHHSESNNGDIIHSLPIVNRKVNNMSFSPKISLMGERFKNCEKTASENMLPRSLAVASTKPLDTPSLSKYTMKGSQISKPHAEFDAEGTPEKYTSNVSVETVSSGPDKDNQITSINQARNTHSPYSSPTEKKISITPSFLDESPALGSTIKLGDVTSHDTTKDDYRRLEECLKPATKSFTLTNTSTEKKKKRWDRSNSPEISTTTTNSPPSGQQSDQMTIKLVDQSCLDLCSIPEPSIRIYSFPLPKKSRIRVPPWQSPSLGLDIDSLIKELALKMASEPVVVYSSKGASFIPTTTFIRLPTKHDGKTNKSRPPSGVSGSSSISSNTSTQFVEATMSSN